MTQSQFYLYVMEYSILNGFFVRLYDEFGRNIAEVEIPAFTTDKEAVDAIIAFANTHSAYHNNTSVRIPRAAASLIEEFRHYGWVVNDVPDYF